ncbi:MAG: UDP-N-acetylmuramate--L-alanine ligase [Ferruginibacter sp.]|nr:UDP-N-acetylmuramate--L-alanine ligase [Ferruginibacter sp.]
MNGIQHIRSVYFLGIGGIGMSALARYFISRNVSVSGYDKTETSLTKQLELEGMAIHYDENIELIDKSADLVIYTPAIPATHRELVYFQKENIPLLKRSDVLGMITENSFNICVAGTHGKTTTSAMIAHLLRATGYGANAFLGGIASNYDTNFWSSENDVCVVEADEYDRSFLKLSPDIAIITAMDPDHLDIYGTAEKMEEAFIDFTKRIRCKGILFSKYGLKRTGELVADQHQTYAARDESADIFAQNLQMNNGSYHFDCQMPGRTIAGLVLNMGGMHNLENAVAAIAVAARLNIAEEKIREAVASFRGVKRRFEYVVKNEQLVFIDDYAHHPEELRALINGAKDLFPAKKCTVIFQPHLFSRTKDLAEGFAEVLSIADETVLLPIYPARELPMPGVESEMILSKLTNAVHCIKDKNELPAWLESQQTELLILAGAGDIDTMVEPLKKILLNN